MDENVLSDIKGKAAQPWGAAPAKRAARAVDSALLLAGQRELTIRHGTDEYRLRVTRQNKLILTK